MDSNKKYWKGLEELNKTPGFVEKNKHEFAEPIPIEDVLSGNGLMGKTPRRDFLKAVGFGVGAVTLAACQKVPVHKSIPYLIKPEEVTPGVANYYTSTYEGHAILVKTREGRPIKVEGNPKDIMGKGGLSAQAQASVLDLYDVNRVKNPMRNGTEYEWNAIDEFVKSELANMALEHFPDAEVIAGVATAGIAHGVMAADLLKLPFIYVRAKPKEHGMGNQIEGEMKAGQKVVVVEDLISTGKSSLEVVEVLRAAGAEVVGMIGLFTYGFPQADEAFAKAGLPLYTISNYAALMEVAGEQKLVGDDEMASLAEWRTNPSTWGK